VSVGVNAQEQEGRGLCEYSVREWLRKSGVSTDAEERGIRGDIPWKASRMGTLYHLCMVRQRAKVSQSSFTKQGESELTAPILFWEGLPGSYSILLLYEGKK
jgi:hypothetical protein